MTCRYGLVVKLFQVIFYQPGCDLQQIWPVTIWAIFVGFSHVLKTCSRVVEQCRRPNIEKITAHLLAGAITLEKHIRKSSSGAWSGPWRLMARNYEKS